MTSTLDRGAASGAPDASSALPNTPPAGPPRQRRGPAAWLRRHRVSLAWFLPAFAVGFAAQIVNLAGSPVRTGSEGTITAQAWAVGKLGELSPFGSGYDHPPLGWLQLAGYTTLTSAFERHDIAVLAGREFMVMVTLVSAALLWMLARRLRLSRPAATGALLLFTLSPLALQFHRTVTLEGIAMMWLLAAFVLALSRRRQLAAFLGAAVAFGVAVLSSQTVLLTLPLLGWLMWRNAHPSSRRRTLSLAASVLLAIGVGSVLLAFLNGALTTGGGRAGLIDGVIIHLGWGQTGDSLADPDGLVSTTFGQWWQLDRVGIIAAGVAAAGALFMRRLRPFGITFLLLSAFLLVSAFLLRPGGSVPASVVVLLIPFAALLISGVVLSAASSLLPKSSDTFPRQAIGVVMVAAALAAGIVAGPLWTTQLRGLVLADRDQPMRDAQSWIEANITTDSRLIVDDAMWVELMQAGFARDAVIRYSTLDTDPDTAAAADPDTAADTDTAAAADSAVPVPARSSDGWRDSDYVVSTDSMRTLTRPGDGARQAIDNSLEVARFGQREQRVDIREVAPDGIDGANAELQAAYAVRAAAGSQLAANPALSLEGDSGDLLAGGRVDSRVILSLGQLLGDGAVTVEAFPLVAGESDTVRRQVLVSSNDDASLDDWFRSLGAPVAPSSVVATSDGVLVTFPLGEPEALLPPVAP
ncbi:glycosyltransferase family 39 protein [Herbiconiux sp. CPCC 205763]|uniref:Glycosyltransferase family 39 protein n=1 Tax=Herbiconiux aconitum TaxID=2970913 RepID=A0ABT2GUM4_9MICO|nr:glycosyltransferase family 39 protein [Herbiconiux aconitum]MCS5719907.1 glycosyltransferase family 39 protein [Herbiconiux aconitum]